MYFLAIGLPHEIAHGSLRMTLSDEVSKEDLDYVVDNYKSCVRCCGELEKNVTII